MRHITFIMLALLIFSCSSTKKASSNLALLNGSWTPVKQEIGGKDLPASYFQAQKLLIQDTTYTFTAESVDKGTLSYNNGQMDIYGKEGVNKGKHFTALYKLENNQLAIIYNLKGDGYPSDFETKSKPTLFLSVFKKD
ncbi:MAG: TIGR03067 domain-containing protein [Chitinophagaceae bacterium]|nr:TIGR03067 domain-containing protein [Chitinophagaceae bacterium]